ncbi:MAG: DEAD/DEAH box helicase [Sphaerochaetaceae bacterium]|nr:DEAD/DEAH box helicase [Sphaerochaetaceae bacterium]
MRSDAPLIVQSDKTLLLDVHNSEFESCRNALIAFSELIKAPEHIHTYCISAISLFNASSCGFDSSYILNTLEKYSKYDIPSSVRAYIQDFSSRYGKIILTEKPSDEEHLSLEVKDPQLYEVLHSSKALKKLLLPSEDPFTFNIKKFDRGNVKIELIKRGYPVDDRIPLVKSEAVPITLKTELREYQENAVSSILGDGGRGSGYGVLVMPCGSGKTVVGMKIMQELSTRTLILCPNIISARQWIRELVTKTDVDISLIGEYSGERKEIKPITVCTYQVLTHRADKEGSYPNMKAILEGQWGLVIYDEVHMLPAPVFRITAEMQAVYRVGLTATLIREDGLESDVFSLVGPKRFDIPWTDLQEKGWIARAYCVEVKVPLPHETMVPYAVATKREKHKIACMNKDKLDVVETLLIRHKGEKILIIAQYLDQIKVLSKRFDFPVITGSTPNSVRDRLYQAFRDQEVQTLIVSKVANFAIDLPDASVAIELSGTFGSRQEEAQRLGRLLRPKKNPCFFYSVVSKMTVEEECSANRQKFLAEQGYTYKVMEI